MMKKICWIIGASIGIGRALTFILERECEGFKKLFVLKNALKPHKEQQVVSCDLQDTASLRTTYALIQLHCGRLERIAFI